MIKKILNKDFETHEQCVDSVAKCLSDYGKKMPDCGLFAACTGKDTDGTSQTAIFHGSLKPSQAIEIANRLLEMIHDMLGECDCAECRGGQLRMIAAARIMTGDAPLIALRTDVTPPATKH